MLLTATGRNHRIGLRWPDCLEEKRQGEWQPSKSLTTASGGQGFYLYGNRFAQTGFQPVTIVDPAYWPGEQPPCNAALNGVPGLIEDSIHLERRFDLTVCVL
jgi:hypothetical protein